MKKRKGEKKKDIRENFKNWFLTGLWDLSHKKNFVNFSEKSFSN